MSTTRARALADEAGPDIEGTSGERVRPRGATRNHGTVDGRSGTRDLIVIAGMLIFAVEGGGGGR